jgi:hypothetical protein
MLVYTILESRRRLYFRQVHLAVDITSAVNRSQQKRYY